MTVWRTAAGCDSSTCVGVARDGDTVYVTDTKDDDPPLAFSVEEWNAFRDGVKRGDFDELPPFQKE